MALVENDKGFKSGIYSIIVMKCSFEAVNTPLAVQVPVHSNSWHIELAPCFYSVHLTVTSRMNV